MTIVDQSEYSRVYPLYLTLNGKVAVFGSVAMGTLFGVFLLLAALPIGGKTGGPPIYFAVLWLMAVSFMWYQILSIPFRIEVRRSGEIRFVSVVKKVEVNPLEIESIKPVPGQFGFFTVKHRNGKLRLLVHFDGFHEFVTNLKEANPGVELRGC